MINGPFLFVSYSSKDASFVHPEIERFERQGYNVWFDQGELQPARFWVEEIRKAIEACACFVVFITEDAVVSANVCDEISQALAGNKPIVGIYWDNVELPSRLQSQIRRRQTLDRYSLHASVYGELLESAIAEYVGATETRLADTQEIPRLTPPQRSSDKLPMIVFFGLLLFVVLAFVLAVVVFVIPYIPSLRRADDPFNNRFIGAATGLFFLGIATAFAAGAFAVFRTYLRSKE